MTTEEDAFEPDISVSDLHDGWTVDNQYSSTVRLNAPEGDASHIVLQPWEEDSETMYVVTPMVDSNASGATAESDGISTKSFDDLDRAIRYAEDLTSEIGDWNQAL